MININCTAMTEMCAIVLPQMVAKNKGVVVNISSVAVSGAVGVCTYAATKTFMSSLSQALRRTYCGKGSGKCTSKFQEIFTSRLNSSTNRFTYTK